MLKATVKKIREEDRQGEPIKEATVDYCTGHPN